MWSQIEKHYTIANRLPDVINFYPVIGEQVVEIAPIQLARNTVQKRLDNLVTYCARVESLCEVENQAKSLIQSTIDSGVSGGLPLYKVQAKFTLAHSLCINDSYFYFFFFFEMCRNSSPASTWKAIPT